jgi:TonB-linked SusC/RagA family outer membrane protein
MRSKFKWIFTLLVAFTVQFTFAQERTITGTVSDSQGTLPGATVLIKGTNKGTQTDIDGKYSISAKTGEVLVFRYVGMSDKSVTVGASNTVNVTLDAGIKLADVVVEGYKTTTKKTTVVAQKTVTSETIEDRPNASFLQTLQGQVAGLGVLTGNGQPGSSSSVLIRGAGSLTGYTDPLYVIDGMATYQDNFRSLNPDDIESVTVLKDAAATAIYGNRGSNGVIVVTTKRGGNKEGKMQINYSATIGTIELQHNNYDLANAKELLTLEKRYQIGGGLGTTLTDQQIASFPINTDWVNYFFRTGSTSTHQLSITNPGKYLNSYSSVGYTDQDGLLVGTGLQRYSFRNNLDIMSKNEKFKLETSASINFSRSNLASSLGTGGVNQNYVLGATLGAPYISPSQYTTSEQLISDYQANGTLVYTPLFLIDKLRNFVYNADETRTLVTADLSYEIFKDLTFRSRTSMDLTDNRVNQSQAPNSFNAILFLDPGQEFGGNETIQQTRDFRFSQLYQVDYTKTFAEKHTVSFMANTEYTFGQITSFGFTQTGLDPQVWSPNTGDGYVGDSDPGDYYVPSVFASRWKGDLISYFGQLDYDFDKRFGVVGTIRYDGTNRFPEKNRWGTFYSVGGRWNIDSENFMKNSSFVNTLKLRASYGVTGNQLISPLETDRNPIFDIYGIADNVYNSQSGYVASLGYPFIWETTYSSDIGVDFGFQKNRIRGTVDVYNRRTTHLLNNEPIPPITGQTGIDKNSDLEVHNKGIEADIAYDVLKTNDFTLTLRGNWAYNDNSVDHIKDPGFIDGGNVITYNGGLVREWYLYPYVGVNKENGNLLFLDANNNVTENPVDADRRRTGKNSTPVYQGSFGFDIDYKGFYAASTFTYAGRVYRIDYDLANFYDPASLGQFVTTRDLLDAWTIDNAGSNVPALHATNTELATEGSDRFLVNASYIRVRNAQIGYRVPKKFLDKTFIAGASFFIMGENLYTWSKWRGYDAESNRLADQSYYPTPKIWTFGVNLKF